MSFTKSYEKLKQCHKRLKLMAQELKFKNISYNCLIKIHSFLFVCLVKIIYLFTLPIIYSFCFFKYQLLGHPKMMIILKLLKLENQKKNQQNNFIIQHHQGL